jgi:hypothetical protein
MIASRIALASASASLFAMAVGALVLPRSVPGYSSIGQTVSDLAAVGAPTRSAMNVCGSVTAGCLIILAVFLIDVAWPARTFLALAGFFALSSLVVPKPAPHVDTPGHTAAVTCLAVFLGFWPLAVFAHPRRRWAVSLRATGWYTGFALVLGLTFLFNWLQASPITGLLERLFLFTELIATLAFTALGTRAEQLGDAADSAAPPRRPDLSADANRPKEF